MKIIIAGSRQLYCDAKTLDELISGYLRLDEDKDEIVSGGSGGIDEAAIELAHVFQMPLTVFEPDWKKHGKSAGPIRNKQMADYADFLIAIWDGKSKGTSHMIEIMRTMRKPFLVIYVEER